RLGTAGLGGARLCTRGTHASRLRCALPSRLLLRLIRDRAGELVRDRAGELVRDRAGELGLALLGGAVPVVPPAVEILALVRERVSRRLAPPDVGQRFVDVEAVPEGQYARGDRR